MGLIPAQLAPYFKICHLLTQFGASLSSIYACIGLLLTLLDPAYFGPFKTQGGGQICPQAFSFFSCTPGESDLLKNGFTIKFSQKS